MSLARCVKEGKEGLKAFVMSFGRESWGDSIHESAWVIQNIPVSYSGSGDILVVKSSDKVEVGDAKAFMSLDSILHLCDM